MHSKGFGVSDQRILVRNARSIGEINHRIRVILLITGTGIGKQSVDTANAAELRARITSKIASTLCLLVRRKHLYPSSHEADENLRKDQTSFERHWASRLALCASYLER